MAYRQLCSLRVLVPYRSDVGFPRWHLKVGTFFVGGFGVRGVYSSKRGIGPLGKIFLFLWLKILVIVLKLRTKYG
jgi:hypothetical protein